MQRLAFVTLSFILFCWTVVGASSSADHRATAHELAVVVDASDAHASLQSALDPRDGACRRATTIIDLGCNVTVLVNSKVVATLRAINVANECPRCVRLTLHVSPSQYRAKNLGGAAVLAFYTSAFGFLGTLPSTGVVVITESNSHVKHEATDGTATLPASSAWILYDVWHAYASTAIRQQRAGVVTSVEEILQSNGGLLLENVYTDNAQAAAGFYYHTTPRLGPYCLYRKRPSEPTGILPDCPNIQNTTTTHAQVLNALGIDTIVVDGTNLGTFNDFSDALQLRPMEVLAEEWFKLREQGQTTPTMVAWNTLPTGSNLWQYYLTNIYNNVNLTQLIARDASSGKMIFFTPGNPDPNVIAQVESNGGLNNVVVVQMWANYPPSQFTNNGIWTFMAPCTSPSSGGYTTSVANLPSTCNQLLVPSTPLGSMMSVSPSYQLGYGSLPFQAAGKMNTWTLQIQFATAIATAPDNLLLSTFNEFIAQPQANPFPHSTVASMGLTWDPMNVSLWVDTYGGSLARDIEPSAEFGSAIYDMASSCMRVSALSRSLGLTRQRGGTHEQSPPLSMKALCEASKMLSTEACCSITQTRRNIWSLRTDGRTDYLLTNNPAELDILVQSGSWMQICNAFGGPTAFCVDGSLVDANSISTGPFVMATAPDQWTGAGVAIHRCRTTGGTHFFSSSNTCEGQIVEFLLGYVATYRSSEFPRAFRRCYDLQDNGIHYHSLDLPCPLGHQETMYGYVH